MNAAPEAAEMHVAVAIVGFRNAPDIVRCLAALAASSHRDFEVVICENGGVDAHAALCAGIPRQLPGGQRVRAILASGNLGYAGGVNVCLAETPEADAWWVLNPDTIPDVNALLGLVARLSRGDCDLVAGLMHHDDQLVESYGGRWRPWLARAESIGRGRKVTDRVDEAWVVRHISYVPGGSMLVSRRFVETAGPMREDYFLYGEEIEWCVRGSRRGMRIGIAPGARILHNQGSTTGSAAAMLRRPKLPIYLDERNKMLITRDHYPGRLPVAGAAALALAVLRYGRKRAWRQLGYAVSGWAAGLANRRGIPRWMTQHGG